MLGKLAMNHDRIGYGLKPTEGTKYYKTLKIIAYISFFIMLIAQAILLIAFKGEQISDAEVYLRWAKECAENGWWYPAKSHVYSSYLFGNGLINLTALVLAVTKSLKVMFFINILFVQTILWSCLYIIKKVFNRDSLCYWFVILFCWLNTFWSEAVQLRTETMFTAFAFLGIAVLFSDKKWAYPVSGILLALANWVRPVALAFLIGAICVLIYKSKKIRHAIAVVAGYAVVILLIGTISFISCGHFVYQSTTFGFNLIMSANDDADGSYMVVVNEGQVGYIEPEVRKTMTFKDRDEYYTKLSLEWIKDNPLGYLKQIPAKMFFLYGTETYSGSVYFNNEKSTAGMDYIKSVANKFTGNSDEAIHIGDVLIVFNQLWYMMIAVMFAIGTVLFIKKKQWRCMVPLWISMLGGTGITILVVGSARYHFPYLPVMIISAAFAFEYIFARVKTKKLQKGSL